jgi:hypothetical protein
MTHGAPHSLRVLANEFRTSPHADVAVRAGRPPAGARECNF